MKLFTILPIILLAPATPVSLQRQDVDEVQARLDAAGRACSPICYVGERPACEVTWGTHVSAVFLGAVADLKEENGPKTVRFIATVAIEEAFIGTEAKVVTVVTGGDSCGGFPFSNGKRYLIYAKQQDDGTFSVALCGGTKWASEASADLKYLRSLSSAPTAGTLFGTAYRYKQPISPHSKAIRHLYPLAGEKVKIKSVSQSYEAIVGLDGKFKAENLQPGNYTVNIDTTEPLLIEGSGGFTWRQNLPDGLILTVPTKGCAQVDFKIDPFHGKRK
jgi:hypothetical protein